MTVTEIKHMIRTYAEAAGRLKEAGFDALLVMGGGGYLINQFLSPAWNQRTDEYGGSVEKRMTFLIETLQETKKVVGEKYPIIVSLNMDDLLPEGVAPCRGMVVEETIATAQKLEELGLADAFHLRIGNYYNQEYIIPSAYVTNAEYMKNFRKFKAAVTRPVIFENKLNSPEEMQQLLEDGILAVHDGEAVKISADAVVLAMGYRNCSTLYTDLLDNLDCEVYQIGDCRQTRKIADAVREGHIIAKNL